MKPNKLLIVSILALPIFLTACGGGSGSSANTATTAGSGSSATTINGISVPPAPDPVINNATLAGVDSNNNGVRDDVERKIASNIKNQANFERMKAYAKAEEKIITAPTPTTRADGLKMLSESYCAMGLSGAIESDVLNNNTIADTQIRKEKISKFNDVVGAYFSEEVSCKGNQLYK